MTSVLTLIITAGCEVGREKKTTRKLINNGLLEAITTRKMECRMQNGVKRWFKERVIMS